LRRTTRCLAFAPDVRTMAAGLNNGPHDQYYDKDHPQTLDLWEVATGRRRSLAGHPGHTSYVLFSPDGTTLATLGLSGSRQQPIFLWDLASGQLVREVTGLEGDLGALAFSGDGKLVAGGGADNSLGGSDKSLRLWETATGKELYQLVPPEDPRR